MNSLPSSIEKYLTEEAGFSSTEVLALRHLLHGEAMTLRELATKTGKSTGVLDQAMKKLLTRKILRREMVNDTPKFALASPEDIRLWMKKDIQEKQKILRRKEQDFESFVRSIEQDIARPQIEYFEGEEGLKKAYGKLLDLSDKELFLYLPMLCKEEEDPLGECRAQFARERKRRKIFLRVVGHECPLGKRYQSRDQFEFRKTVLVPQSACPLSFEKAIAGDSIACFNHEQKRACFIHYPELAEAEREMFEVTAKRQKGADECPLEEENTLTNSSVHSGVKWLFRSKKGLVGLAVCAVIAGVIAQSLHLYMYRTLKQQVGERLLSIVATAAPELSENDIQKIHFARDMGTAEYSRIFEKLNQIRDQNENIRYVYVLRPTDQETLWQFVADADSSWELVAMQEEGMAEVDVVAPGTFYDISYPESLLKYAIPNEPFAEDDFVTDEWGTNLAAYAPIQNEGGDTIAILGVDMDVTDVLHLTNKKSSIWRWFSLFFVHFLGFMIFQFSSQEEPRLRNQSDATKLVK